MFVFIPPPGSGPTIGDLVEAFESFTWKDGVILLICLILGWASAYGFLSYHHGHNAWGLKGISFVLGNFVGILYFMISCLVQTWGKK